MVDTTSSYFKVHDCYAFTLNPVDKYQFFGHKDRFRRFRNFVYEQFLSFSARYELFIELSEPRGMHTAGYMGPRLHMHGTVCFETKKQLGDFLMNDYYSLLRWTSVDIDTVDCYETWLSYCTKQHLIKDLRIASFTS